MNARTATLIAALGGALLATQARVNGSLAGHLGSAVPAAAISFAVGLLAAVAIAVGRGSLGPGWAARQRVRPPFWQYLGGLGGAFLVGASAYAEPLIGVAFLTVCTVAGQTAGSLGIDRVGLGPSGRHPVTRDRAAGAALAIVALGVAAAGSGGSAWPALFALLAVVGAGVALQQTSNGRLGQATGQPAFAAVVSFAGGTIVLTAISLGMAATGHLGPLHWPGGADSWTYLGGLGGGLYITLSAFAVPVIGVLRLSLASIAGQLIAGIVLDLAAPTGSGLRPLTAVAAVLTCGAVALAGRVRPAHPGVEPAGG